MGCSDPKSDCAKNKAKKLAEQKANSQKLIEENNRYLFKGVWYIKSKKDAS